MIELLSKDIWLYNNRDMVPYCFDRNNEKAEICKLCGFAFCNNKIGNKKISLDEEEIRRRHLLF